MLAIPFSLPRAFGRIVGDNRQGYAILGVMAAIFVGVASAILTALEAGGAGTAPQLAGGAMEGKELRFGIFGSTLFGGTTHAHLDRRGQLDARQLHRRSAA